MTPQWIGVIGTAIGAGIGSLVAIVSVLLRARQEATAEARQHNREESRRARDRTWDITLQGLDARRQMYATLLRGAAAYDRQLKKIAELPQSSSDDRQALRLIIEQLDTARADLEDLVFEVDVHAQHPLVGDALRELLQQGQAAGAALEGSRWNEAREQASASRLLIRKLRDVCRWDLGLFAPDPYEDSTESAALEPDEKRPALRKRKRPSGNELGRSEQE